MESSMFGSIKSYLQQKLLLVFFTMYAILYQLQTYWFYLPLNLFNSGLGSNLSWILELGSKSYMWYPHPVHRWHHCQLANYGWKTILRFGYCTYFLCYQFIVREICFKLAREQLPIHLHPLVVDGVTILI